MDARHFDALTRLLGDAGSRRRVLAVLAALPLLGGLVSGLPRPLASEARGKNKRKHRGKNKDKMRTTAQAEPCWRVGACMPKKGANVSRCDLAGYTPNATVNCTGCNASGANLSGANLQGANFTRANLSGACLVDADFTDATFANSTNLSNAIFCRTIMPDGSTNNSGCASATACCPTCNRGVGMTCGTPGDTCCGSVCQNGACVCVAGTCQSLNGCGPNVPDGCGGLLQCGSCPIGATPTCNSGTCVACAASCPAECPTCLNLVDGSTRCDAAGAGFSCIAECTSDDQCPGDNAACLVSYTSRDSNQTTFGSDFCGGAPRGFCTVIDPCAGGARAAR